MKKRLICIGLFTLSSFVHAASFAAKKQFTLVWRVEADARVRLPGEPRHRHVHSFPDDNLKFSPPAGVSSPIFIEFDRTPSRDTVQANYFRGKSLKVEVPGGVASWRALPDGTTIVVAAYRAKYDCDPSLTVTLGQTLPVDTMREDEKASVAQQKRPLSAAETAILSAHYRWAAHSL